MGPRRSNRPPQINHPNLQDSEWRCCFGLHVKTATIFIGCWHLILNVAALCFLMVIWANPRYIENFEGYNESVDLNAPALPTPLSKVDNQYAYRDHSLHYGKYDNFDLSGLVCLCMIAITLMVIYGAIKGKPSHLLPFLCLQLFDFVVTTLTATGYLCYLSSMPRLIADSHRLPWREKILELSPKALVSIVLLTFVALVFLKAYSIRIIWRCYRYLSLDQRFSEPNYIIHTADHLYRYRQGVGPNDLSLLPNYDDVMSLNLKQAPPPSYQVAMSNLEAAAAAENSDEKLTEPPSYNNLSIENNNRDDMANANEDNRDETVAINTGNQRNPHGESNA